MPRYIQYNCALCDAEAKVTQEPEGHWIDKDLSGRNIIRPDADRPPLASHWVEFSDKYYCPMHELAFHRMGAKLGKQMEFFSMHGLSELVKKEETS